MINLSEFKFHDKIIINITFVRILTQEYFINNLRNYRYNMSFYIILTISVILLWGVFAVNSVHAQIDPIL